MIFLNVHIKICSLLIFIFSYFYFHHSHLIDHNLTIKKATTFKLLRICWPQKTLPISLSPCIVYNTEFFNLVIDFMTNNKFSQSTSSSSNLVVTGDNATDESGRLRFSSSSRIRRNVQCRHRTRMGRWRGLPSMPCYFLNCAKETSL